MAGTGRGVELHAIESFCTGEFGTGRADQGTGATTKARFA